MAVIVKTVNMPKTCKTCDFMEWNFEWDICTCPLLMKSADIDDEKAMRWVKTEDLFHDEKDNGLKENFGDIDTQIDSLMGNLEWIQDECDRAMDHMKILEIQYERLKPVLKPVKHGSWVGNERHTSCSICGQTYCVPDGQEGCLDMTFYKYCPNCGARMDAND